MIGPELEKYINKIVSDNKLLEEALRDVLGCTHPDHPLARRVSATLRQVKTGFETLPTLGWEHGEPYTPSLPSTTRSCPLCKGEPINPWPPIEYGGPTHHTCHPGEERCKEYSSVACAGSGRCMKKLGHEGFHTYGVD